MTTNSSNFIAQNKNIFRIALAVGLILLVPLTASLVSDDMAWTAFDFAFAGTVLFGTGLAFELITRKGGNVQYRAAVGIALLGALMLLWINLAAGIVGSDDNAANVLFLAPHAALVIGALVAQLRPAGMARAMVVTAFVQALVTVFALVSGSYPMFEVVKVVLLNGFFITLWAVSAMLFRRAALSQPQV
ncbi:MAG: hypothetical protein EPO32_05755 [Anaerolineae bacterium]|nr:MAG: hypothetical protein EPO32_05755 [Anaerolineae bacterium]